MNAAMITREDARAWLAAHNVDAELVIEARIVIGVDLDVRLECLEYERGADGRVAVPSGLTSPRHIISTRPLLSLPKLSGYGQRPPDEPERCGQICLRANTGPRCFGPVCQREVDAVGDPVELVAELERHAADQVEP